MKTPIYVIILLAAALVAVSVRLAYVSNDSQAQTLQPMENSVNNDMSALDCIMTRTSVRAYTDRQVPDSVVETLLRAGMAAPTAGNKQPWRFVVVQNRAVLDTLAGVDQYAAFLKMAPLAIVVCGVPAETFPDEGEEYWVQDCSAASENILLAAHAEGMGAVWCGVYPLTERVEALRKILGLPKELVPLNIISIGYPRVHQQPKDKWDAKKILRI